MTANNNNKKERFIELSPAFYAGLKKRYNEAVSKKESQFTFEGNEYVTAYAKYLLQYCEMMGVGK